MTTARWFDDMAEAAERAQHRADRRALVVVSSRYRCREHLDQPVTLRGAGCQLCPPTGRSQRRRDRQAHR